MLRVFDFMKPFLLKLASWQRDHMWRARATTTASIGFIEPVRPSSLRNAVFISLLTLAVALCVSLRFQTNEREALQLKLPLLQRDAQRLQTEVAKGAPGLGIANQLPRQIDASALLTRIQRLAAEGGITLVGLAPSKDTGNVGTAGLSRQSWDMQMSGSYSAVKEFLGRLLDQSPELWLTHVHLRSNGTGIDAQISLQAWGLDMPSEQPRPMEGR